MCVLLTKLFCVQLHVYYFLVVFVCTMVAERGRGYKQIFNFFKFFSAPFILAFTCRFS